MRGRISGLRLCLTRLRGKETSGSSLVGKGQQGREGRRGSRTGCSSRRETFPPSARQTCGATVAELSCCVCSQNCQRLWHFHAARFGPASSGWRRVAPRREPLANTRDSNRTGLIGQRAVKPHEVSFSPREYRSAGAARGGRELIHSQEGENCLGKQTQHESPRGATTCCKCAATTGAERSRILTPIERQQRRRRIIVPGSSSSIETRLFGISGQPTRGARGGRATVAAWRESCWRPAGRTTPPQRLPAQVFIVEKALIVIYMKRL